MMTVMAVVGARLYYLQVIKTSEYAQLADRNRIRIRHLPAPRGLVFDRRHRPLVNTRPSFDAVVVPEDSDNLSQTIERLQDLLGDDDIADKVVEAEQNGRAPYDPITVDENLDWQQVVALETHQLDLPGVSLQIMPARHYLYGDLAAHLLGYVGEVSRNDLLHLANYRMGDEIGKFGLERGWEPYLRGVAGGEEIEVDAVGRKLRVLKEIPDHQGESVVLTIDLDVQQAAEQAMEGKNGALVAIDPNTGYILAMVSHPAFDPNIFVGGITPANWRKLITDPEHPLEDRVIQGIYPPGSTFKLVDSVAGMEERTLTPETTYNCPGGMWYGGREYHCWRRGGHGTIALHRAIVSSCDVYFYNVGLHLGIDRLAHWAHLLGLGRKTGIDLHGESPGIMPSSAWKERMYHQPWYPAETLSVAIGQGYVAATPLQMAEVVSEIANGGVRYKPQFVHYVEGLDGHVIKSYPPVVEARLNIDPKYLETIRDAMAGVVNSPWGTAHRVRLPNVTVCAKTGTAQVIGAGKAGVRAGEPEGEIPVKYRDHGWLVAFAPEDHPQIAVACVIEHGGHGGSSAGPIVHDVLEKFFELYPPNAAQQLTGNSGAAPAMAAR
jgi:penicillin-binding protein 2